MSYFFAALANVLSLVIGVYKMIIIASALITWVNPDPYNPIVRLLYGLTEPVYRLLRRFLPRALLRLRIDLTPMIALLLLVFLEMV